MSRTKEPQISRLERVGLYSSNINTALEQLIKDVSALYVFGYSDEKIKSLATVRNAVNHVNNLVYKNASDDSNTSHGRIPNVEKLVDYIFLNDEANNVLGLWNKFDYLFPLQVFDYSKHLTEEKSLSRINSFKLAGLLFAIFSFYKIKTLSSTRNLITKMQNVETPSQNNIKLLDELITHKDDALIIEKASSLQQLAGIDLDTVEDYCENVLELNYRSHKYSIKDEEYKSRRIIFGINLLYEEFNLFIEDRADVYSELFARIGNKFESGVVSPNINKIYKKYEQKLMRDRATYFNLAHLIDNPFIRIERDDNNLNCYSQFQLCSYKFVFDSLYKHGGIFKFPLIHHFNYRTLNEQAKRDIDKKDIKFIYNKLIATGIAKKPVDSQFLGKDNVSIHFKQITKVTPIVNKISNTGILIDSDRLEIVKAKYEEAYKNSEKSNDIKASGKYKTYLRNIEKIDNGMNSVKNDLAGTENRIFGYFTPSGASTHRMTCSKLALQAFPKEIMCEIMTAPKGKVLVSLDVSGQDITVALNLAKRFYTENHSFDNQDSLNEFKYFSDSFEETFDIIKDEEYARPIDKIASLLFSELSSHYELGEIRKFVKNSIYVIFYGGGYQTLIKKAMGKVGYKDSENSALEFIKDEVRQFNESANGFDVIPPLHHEILTLSLEVLAISTFDELKVFAKRKRIKIERLCKNIYATARTEYEDFILKCGILKMHLSNDYLRGLPIKINAAEEKEVPPAIFYKVIENIEYYYSGLLESLEFYEKYYHENDETYPTLLGWSTTVELSNNIGKMITKSKSYPIQASGAEFIRQWILELAKVRNGYEKQFIIVNIIHDQIIVEVSTKHEAKIKALLVSSAKDAATKVGIDKDTLFFGEPEVVSNRWLNHEISCDKSL